MGFPILQLDPRPRLPQCAIGSGISNPFVANNHIERTCNHFAAEFLAPMSSFATIVEAVPRTIRSDTAAFIRAVSEKSLLSMQATAIRMVEGEFLTQQQLRGWQRIALRNLRAEKEEEIEAAGEGRGAIHAKRISELGYLPTYVAAVGVDRKIVDTLDVQSGLSLSAGLQASAFALAKRRMKAALSE